MTDTPALCPACGVALSVHWRCAVCACFGHANVQARYDKTICKDCDKALAARGVRHCRVCGRIKPLAKFRPTRAGREWRCTACVSRGKPRPDAAVARRRLRAWRERNRERYNERARARYRTRIDVERERQRRLYELNKEKHQEYARAYHAKHREKRKAYAQRQRILRKLAILRGER